MLIVFCAFFGGFRNKTRSTAVLLCGGHFCLRLQRAKSMSAAGAKHQRRLRQQQTLMQLGAQGLLPTAVAAGVPPHGPMWVAEGAPGAPPAMGPPFEGFGGAPVRLPSGNVYDGFNAVRVGDVQLPSSMDLRAYLEEVQLRGAQSAAERELLRALSIDSRVRQRFLCAKFLYKGQFAVMCCCLQMDREGASGSGDGDASGMRGMSCDTLLSIFFSLSIIVACHLHIDPHYHVAGFLTGFLTIPIREPERWTQPPAPPPGGEEPQPRQGSPPAVCFPGGLALFWGGGGAPLTRASPALARGLRGLLVGFYGFCRGLWRAPHDGPHHDGPPGDAPTLRTICAAPSCILPPQPRRYGLRGRMRVLLR